MTTRTTELTIKVDASAGSDIPGVIIPEMVRLANKLGVCIEAELNEVKTFAFPEDDPLYLAIAWRRAMKKSSTHPMAFAHEGKRLMEQP